MSAWKIETYPLKIHPMPIRQLNSECEIFYSHLWLNILIRGWKFQFFRNCLSVKIESIKNVIPNTLKKVHYYWVHKLLKFCSSLQKYIKGWVLYQELHKKGTKFQENIPFFEWILWLSMKLGLSVFVETFLANTHWFFRTTLKVLFKQPNSTPNISGFLCLQNILLLGYKEPQTVSNLE